MVEDDSSMKTNNFLYDLINNHEKHKLGQFYEHVFLLNNQVYYVNISHMSKSIIIFNGTDFDEEIYDFQNIQMFNIEDHPIAAEWFKLLEI